jgi:hypothetical protein
MTTSAKARRLAFAAVLAAAGYLVGLWQDWSVSR